jgi:hypothetical protein
MRVPLQLPQTQVDYSLIQSLVLRCAGWSRTRSAMEIGTPAPLIARAPVLTSDNNATASPRSTALANTLFNRVKPMILS